MLKTRLYIKRTVKLIVAFLFLNSFTTSAQMGGMCDAHYFHRAGSAPLSVDFASGLQGRNVDFAWDLGDGSTANTQMVNHIYSAPGSYYVCLTVTRRDSMGQVMCTSNYCDSIRIGNPPPPPTCSAQFAVNVSRMTGQANFAARPNGMNATYSWDFGDGSQGSGPMASHTYTAPGSYWACLTVTKSDTNGTVICTDTHCDSVRIGTGNPQQPTCRARFFYFRRDSVPTVGFFAGRPGRGGRTSFAWDFGDGTQDTGRRVMHSYAADGMYYVCLTITKTDSTGNTICTDTWCDSVNTMRRMWHPHHHRLMNDINDNLSDADLERMTPANSNEATATVYPNPLTATSVIKISDFSAPVSIKVFDSTGRIVMQNDNVSNGELTIDKSSFNSGIYFYEVYNSSEKVNGKLIVR